MKSCEVSIKTRSTPASLTIQGQVTKDTTVKWSIGVPAVEEYGIQSGYITSVPALPQWRNMEYKVGI